LKTSRQVHSIALSLLPLLTSTFATHSFASTEETIALDEMVVTGTRIPQKIVESLTPVTVIHNEALRAAGQSTLIEVLQSLGHVEISANGGAGQLQSVYIRGTNSTHTLVLLDGMRIQSATAGTTALEHIPIDQIERIEILSGPASSLYGSDAIGGVIQIFTKKGYNAPHWNASIGMGSYNTQQGSVGISGATTDTDYSFQLSKTHTEGFSATHNTPNSFSYNPDRDGYINTSASAQLNHRINQDHRLGLVLFHSDGQTRFDAGPSSDAIDNRQLSALAIYSEHTLSPHWKTRFQLGKNSDAEQIDLYQSQIRTDQKQFSWMNTFQLGQAGTLIAGAESLAQDISSDAKTPYTAAHRTTRSLFTGYTAQYAAHHLQLNIRHDQDEQFGGRTTGLAAYGYDFTPKWKGTLSTGTAFKAPTFNDLYYPGFSNADLKPEYSHEWEASLRYHDQTHQASATLFDNRIRDLIALDSTFVPQNVQSARIKGLELRYTGRFDTFSPHLALTFQNPENDLADRWLARRARQHLEAGVHTHWKQWELGEETILSGKRFDDGTNTADKHLGGYTLVNLTASTPLNKNWRLRARANNIFDKYYELAYGYNTSRRNVFISMEYQPDTSSE
jgi:vitamin B12 transporter